MEKRKRSWKKAVEEKDKSKNRTERERGDKRITEKAKAKWAGGHITREKTKNKKEETSYILGGLGSFRGDFFSLEKEKLSAGIGSFLQPGFDALLAGILPEYGSLLASLRLMPP
ncbi:hypothetical protein VNO77_30931 [Canavalia gladiata]|uniref:Uncharacterized protein n=1 Tax=Canavalia gladiata TaxID=3824 RepID=A0AAN9Q3H2_CANGL